MKVSVSMDMLSVVRGWLTLSFFSLSLLVCDINIFPFTFYDLMSPSIGWPDLLAQVAGG